MTFPAFVDPEILKTYRDLQRVKSNFMKGKIPGAFILGSAGGGKSFDFKELDGKYYGKCLYLAGRMTAFAAFCKIRDACKGSKSQKKFHIPIVIDDVEDLLTDPAKVDLLRQLCSVRTLEHGRLVTFTSRSTEAGGDRFICKSPVLILGNDLPKRLSESQRAVFSRLEPFAFNPDARQVHDFMGGRKVDRAVYRWMGQHLNLIQRPDCRWYAKWANRKRRDPKGWRKCAINCFVGLDRPTEYKSRADENERKKLCIVAHLMNDKTVPKSEHPKLFQSRCNEECLTGGSRADFFNVKRRYVASGGRR